MIKLVRAAVVLAAGFAGACGSSGSPEDAVRAVVAEAEKAAEARDLSGVMDLVADSYADSRGQAKADVRNLMRGFFVLNQSVHLLARLEELQFESDEVATAIVTVGMLGRQSQEDWAYAADVYAFDVRLRNVDGEWKLQSADRRRRGT